MRYVVFNEHAVVCNAHKRGWPLKNGKGGGGIGESRGQIHQQFEPMVWNKSGKGGGGGRAGIDSPRNEIDTSSLPLLSD